MEALQAELVSLFMAVIMVCVGFITRKAHQFLNDKGILAKLDANKELVKIVVNAVEQTYKALDGAEKFAVAKSELVSIMNKKKIPITEKELDFLIESVVKESKQNFKK